MPSVLVAVLGCPPTPIWSSHFASSQDPTGRNRARSSPLRQATIFAASPYRRHLILNTFDRFAIAAIRHTLPAPLMCAIADGRNNDLRFGLFSSRDGKRAANGP